jgi:large subunit ribosomal protein L10
MARPDKAAAVTELAQEFRASGGAVLTDYRGLTVKQLQELRRLLGDNASYAVVKNTLTKIAAEEAGVEGFTDLLVGPTAIAFIKGDAVEVAKSLRDFARTNPPLLIKGGILDGKTLTVDEIARIADLESREVLLAKLAGAMVASLQNAVFLFNAPLAQVARLAGALQTKAEQDPSVLSAGTGEPAAAADSAPAEETAAAEVAAPADEAASAAESVPAEEAAAAGEPVAAEAVVPDEVVAPASPDVVAEPVPSEVQADAASTDSEAPNTDDQSHPYPTASPTP